MKVSTFSKATIGLAAVATMGFGLVVPAANATAVALTATQEDPTTSTNLNSAPIGPNTLVGVGSDTIQDVEYGISQDLGTQPDGTSNLATWTATGTTALTYRSGGIAPAHPNGSGPGYTALKESLGIVPAGADGVARGDIDYSRASGTQGTPQSGTTGVVTEIPFAIDSISFAAPASSPFLLSNSGKGLTVQNLSDIYSGAVNEINTTTGALQKETVDGTADAGFEPIQAFLPKAQSGSRQFFLKQLSVVPGTGVTLGTNKGDSFGSTAEPTAGTAYVGSGLPGSPTAQVVEHDATVLSAAGSGVAAIAPFSGAKFIGYGNGVIADPSGQTAGTGYVLVPFDSVVGGSAHAVLPYTGSAGSYAPNPAYRTDGTEGTSTLTREVFNIVATRAIQNPNASVKNRELYDTFAGAGSKFCLDTATIQAYGFIKDSNCGNTTHTFNSSATDTGNGYSTANVTVTNTAAVAGRASVFTVNVGSNSNGGGKVAVTINGTVYNGTIAPGATSVNFTVPTPAAGQFILGNGVNDAFTPNLDGVGVAPINPNQAVPLTYSVAKATASVTAVSPKVSHLKKGTVTVKVAAAGLHPTGTVTVFVKTTTGVAKIKVVGAINATTGAVTLSFGKPLPAGTYFVWVAYNGNANINGKALTKLAKLSVV